MATVTLTEGNLMLAVGPYTGTDAPAPTPPISPFNVDGGDELRWRFPPGATVGTIVLYGAGGTGKAGGGTDGGPGGGSAGKVVLTVGPTAIEARSLFIITAAPSQPTNVLAEPPTRVEVGLLNAVATNGDPASAGPGAGGVPTVVGAHPGVTVASTAGNAGVAASGEVGGNGGKPLNGFSAAVGGASGKPGGFGQICGGGGAGGGKGAAGGAGGPGVVQISWA